MSSELLTLLTIGKKLKSGVNSYESASELANDLGESELAKYLVDSKPSTI
jgi:hypothetical protein